jgi:hypothetical protein
VPLEQGARWIGDLTTKNTPKPKTTHVDVHVSGKVCIVGTIKGQWSPRNSNISRRGRRHGGTSNLFFESINASYQTWKELCLALDQDDQGSDRPLEAGPAPSGTDLQWPDLAATDWIGATDGRRVAGGGRRRADGRPKMGRPATKSG